MKTFSLVLLLTLLWTAGEILLKYGIDDTRELNLSLAALGKLATNPWVLASFLVSGTAFLLWIGLLMRMELGFASYLTSLMYVFLLIGARLFLGESITPLKVVGVGLITAGVICVTAEQKRTDTAPLPSTTAQQR